MVTRNDWESFKQMVERANDAQLRDMKNIVDHELHLSETVIKEGYEKRGKSQLIKKWGAI